jgi:DUF4097 and DUF4098 domain-containing protein YvlB
VPAGTTVSGSTSNGEISLTGLDGTVDVRTSNGAITVADVSSDATLRTSNGTVTGTGLTSEVFDARTSNGRIDTTFTQAPRSVVLDTSNGSVDVVLPSDAPPYRVSTSTSNGKVTTEIRTDPAADGSFDIRTSNGSITVRYG